MPGISNLTAHLTDTTALQNPIIVFGPVFVTLDWTAPANAATDIANQLGFLAPTNALQEVFFTLWEVADPDDYATLLLTSALQEYTGENNIADGWDTIPAVNAVVYVLGVTARMNFE